MFALLLAAAAPAVWAQNPPNPPDASAPTLRADILTSRHLYCLTRPIWLRFTLCNPSEEAVELPLTGVGNAEDGVALPLDAIFGTAADPALFVTFHDDKPVPVPPPAGDAAQPQKGTLRLAARGSLGIEIDLREYYPALRYSGNYKVEWRPLGGRANTASVEFRIEARKEAVLVTDKFKITFTLDYDGAPRNVENFLELVKDGFYDGKTIHKIVPGFYIQGGCPKGDGTGIRPDGKLIPAEFHDAPFEAGTLAMALKGTDPNSASCQFFITLAHLPELNGRYTVIGQASDKESLDALRQIAQEPTDARGRPKQPLIIRSISLTDVDQSGVMRFDLKPNHPTSRPAGAAPHESKPANP